MGLEVCQNHLHATHIGRSRIEKRPFNVCVLMVGGRGYDQSSALLLHASPCRWLVLALRAFSCP